MPNYFPDMPAVSQVMTLAENKPAFIVVDDSLFDDFKSELTTLRRYKKSGGMPEHSGEYLWCSNTRVYPTRDTSDKS